jgi:hypothetical protein
LPETCRVPLGRGAHRPRSHVIDAVANDVESEWSSAGEAIDSGSFHSGDGPVIEAGGSAIEVCRQPPLWAVSGIAAT